MRLRSRAATLAAFACALAAVGFSMTAQSADHQDSPATTADPTADINDVYAFMNGANSVVLAMTVYPNAPAGARFSDAVAYVLHSASGSTFGQATSNVDVVATFDANQNISLWVGRNEFVTGNAGGTSGITSADGKVTVFAGLRADPFFFNLDGFHATVADVIAAEPLATNDAGCPTLGATTSGALVKQLASAPDGGTAVNHFGNFNALAIVVMLDKSLVTQGGPLVSVWGSTYSLNAAADGGADAAEGATEAGADAADAADAGAEASDAAGEGG